MEQIALQITNINKVKHFDKSYYIFDEFGGSIGSGSECSFVLQDSNDSINDKHIEIIFDEGDFIITSVNDSEIFYNDSFSKLLAGHGMIISVGDNIKIGDIEFICITPDKIDTSIDTENIKEIKSYDKLDSIKIEPRGKVEGLQLDSVNVLDDLSKDSNDIDITLGLQDNTNNIDNEEIVLTIQTKEKLLNLIKNKLKDSQKPLKLEKQYNTLEYDNLSVIIDNIALLDSNKIINLMLLSIIIKELDTPIFENVIGNTFLEYILGLLNSSVNGNNECLEQIIIRALQKYIDN